MREIRFRGWHTVAMKMFSPEEMSADQLTILPTGSFINVSGSNTSLSVIYPKDKFIPLQFTGLKDKNGVEIYEGDILKRVTGFKRAVEMRQFILGRPSDSKVYGYNWMEGDEVIGNIYENPELINP